MASVQHHSDSAAWKVAIACFIALIMSGPSLIVYTQSQFIEPVTAELGWSRTEFFLPFSIGGVLSAFLMPAIGRAADRFPIRAILLPAIILFSLAYGCLAFVDSSLALYSFLMFACIIFQIPHGALYYAKIISLWPTRRPALLLALAISGNSAGGMILPPIAGWLIADFGWRAARLALGLGTLVVAFSMAYLFIKPPSEARVQRVAPPFGRTMRDALRDRNYWLIILMFALGGFVLSGMMGHIVPLLTERGFSQAIGIAGISVVSGTALAARFLSGMVLDRIESPRAAIPFLLGGLIGIGMLGTVTSPALVILALALLGTAYGAEIELSAYLVRRYLGTRSYGEIYGLVLAIFTIGNSTGPLLQGAAYDLTGSYSVGTMIGAALMLTAAAAVMFLQPYRYPARPEEMQPEPAAAADASAAS